MTLRAHVAVDARMVRHSGIGVYIRSLLPLLAARAPEWRFSVMGPVGALEDLEWRPGSDVALVPTQVPIYSVREQFQVPLTIPTHSDALWVPHYNIPLLYRGPLVVTIHDVLHLAQPYLGGGFHRRVYSRTMFRAVARKADRILAVSDFTRRELIRLTSVNPGKVRRVHNGVGAEWFETAADRARPEPYVVYVGNVKPHKNVGVLLSAFSKAVQYVPHRLLIVGQYAGFWDAQPELLEAAKQSTRVEFLGTVPDRELRSLVGGAEALVLTSLYEGFGLAPLEAMACNCPVLVSRCGSLPEVCGDAAVYCDARDPDDVSVQLLRLLTDEPLRRELRRRGRARAASFTWEACADQTLSAMAEVLQRLPPPVDPSVGNVESRSEGDK